MAAEDTHTVGLDSIPLVIFRSELSHFNEWDIRLLPKRVDRTEVIKKHYVAIDKDVHRMREYIEDLADSIRYDIESEETVAYWRSTGEMLRAIRSLKRKNDAHMGTINEYPPAEQAYLSRDWTNVIEAHRESYSNLIEMDVLYPKFVMMVRTMAEAIWKYAKDEGLLNAFNDFRVERYDSTRKSLVDLRYRERAARGKNERDEEDRVEDV